MYHLGNKQCARQWLRFRYIIVPHRQDHHHQLTTSTTVQLEKLIVAQLRRNFHTFLWTRMFVTMFARNHHHSRSWARRIQSTPSQLFSLRPILILYPNLSVLLPNYLFHPVISTKNLYSYRLPVLFYMPQPFHRQWLNHSKIFCEEYKSWNSLLCSFSGLL
jgi:hypothetical protein